MVQQNKDYCIQVLHKSLVISLDKLQIYVQRNSKKLQYNSFGPC